MRPIAPLAIIPPQAIKLINLGLNSASAGIMWLDFIQKFEAYPKDLVTLLQNVNELDPRFSYPYAFSAIVLPGIGFKDEGIKIAEEGIKKADEDWRIPYYLATNYHMFRKDRTNAALYFDMAARMKNAPEPVKTIAARYGTYQSTLEQTKQIWISIYESSNDETMVERAKNYIIHIELLEALQKAANTYKQQTGSYPKTLEDLVISRIIKQIPESPLGTKFIIRPTGEISVE